MSPEMISFIAVTGFTVVLAVLAVVWTLLRRSGLLFALLIGAAACLAFQYVGLDYVLNGLYALSAALSVPAESLAFFGMEILCVAVYETLAILLLMLLFRRRASYASALAFGLGYWCFFSLTGAITDLVTMLSAEQALFFGQPLDIVASGLQLPLQLPLYLTLSVAIARSVRMRTPGAFFLALLIDLLFRCILASCAVFHVPMLIALGFLIMLALLLIYYCVKAKADFPAPWDEADASLSLESEDAPGEDGDGDENALDGAEDAGDNEDGEEDAAEPERKEYSAVAPGEDAAPEVPETAGPEAGGQDKTEGREGI